MQKYDSTSSLFTIPKEYLNAIISSIKYFISIENKIKKLAAINNQWVLLSDNEFDSSNQEYRSEACCFSKINYIALLALEKMSVLSPSQEQIDSMEELILFVAKPKHLINQKQRC